MVAMRVTILVSMFLIAIHDCTPGIYISSEGCGPPKLEASYMGGENLVGTNLELSINKQSLEEFNQMGFEYGNEYEMMLKTKDGEWMQFVVHATHGTHLEEGTMGDASECDGKVLLFGMDFDSAEFTWRAPTQDEMTDNEVTITTSYAPAYTQAFIQSFNIKPKDLKGDL